MPPKHRTTRSDLFLVRFWLEDTDGASERQSGWGGKVQRAVDGQAREFRDWDALVATLRAMLAATSPELVMDATDQRESTRSESPDIDEE